MEREVINRRVFLKRCCGTGLVGVTSLTGLADTSSRRNSSRCPNVLWLMMDDCRADALGCYGRPWARTPNMDRIANRGVRFETAIVQNPVCIPSRHSMKAGLYPHTLGDMAMGKPPKTPPSYMKRARRGAPNLLNAWRKIGVSPTNVGKIHAYRDDWVNRGNIMPCVGPWGKPVNDWARARLKQGDPNQPYPSIVTKTHKWALGGIIPLEPEQISTWKLGDLAVRTLKELAAKKESFFLRVSFNAPHLPLRVPKSYLIDPESISLGLPTPEELELKPRFEKEQVRIYGQAPHLTTEQIQLARGTYYGMVSLVDTQIGRILSELERNDLMDNTIIAINSDQGFLLGEHGLWEKRCFYDQNVCVPLILSWPNGLPSGRIITEPVEMVDFIPTLMELAGLKPPPSIHGRSLLPLVHGQVSQWRAACFSEIDHSQSMYDELRRGGGRRVMIRTKRWKLEYFLDERVPDKDGSLYDLKNDPNETVNLYNRTEHRPTIEYLEKLTLQWDRDSQKIVHSK